MIVVTQTWCALCKTQVRPETADVYISVTELGHEIVAYCKNTLVCSENRNTREANLASGVTAV